MNALAMIERCAERQPREGASADPVALLPCYSTESVPGTTPEYLSPSDTGITGYDPLPPAEYGEHAWA